MSSECQLTGKLSTRIPNKRNNVCSKELFNSMESLILAQDERWRRA